MRTLSRILGLATTVAALSACGSSGNGNVDTKPTLQALSVAAGDATMTSVVAGRDLVLSATAKYSDGKEVDATADATWATSDAALATVSNDAGSKGHVHGLKEGAVTITVQLEDKQATFALAVGAPVATGLVLTSTIVTVERHQTTSLTAQETLSDGTTRDVTSEVEWSSSDTNTATVAAGAIYGIATGQTTVTAKRGDESAEAQVSVTCTYPRGSRQLAQFGIMPRITWAAAYRKDGTTANFDLKDVYCGVGEFANVKTMSWVISAGWCPNCPAYIRATMEAAPEAEAAGMLFVFATVQDAAQRPSGSAYANRDINGIYANGTGWRVGDTDASPRNFFNNSPYITAFPSAFVIRTRDMKMIADRDAFQSLMPLARMAREPDTDWTHGTPFVNACGAQDDEAGEPNDTSATATRLTTGTHHGGICTNAPDFYRIDIAGSWRFSLHFRSAAGDLDAYVWDPATNQPKMNGQNPIGSYGTTDTEEFIYTGPAIVAVVGFDTASNVYDLTLTQE